MGTVKVVSLPSCFSLVKPWFLFLNSAILGGQIRYICVWISMRLLFEAGLHLIPERKILG